MRITQQEAEKLLQTDLLRFERAVSSLVQYPLSDNQFAALVSFTFNVGIGALKKSSILKALNNKQFASAADRLLLYNRAGGKVMEGLNRRRRAERKLFLS
jgi:lysozyme